MIQIGIKQREFARKLRPLMHGFLDTVMAFSARIVPPTARTAGDHWLRFAHSKTRDRRKVLT
ncbi:MAG: hypothetical protein AMS22_11910, partial [Thiotrichales bacterium SG8_50]